MLIVHVALNGSDNCKTGLQEHLSEGNLSLDTVYEYYPQSYYFPFWVYTVFLSSEWSECFKDFSYPFFGGYTFLSGVVSYFCLHLLVIIIFIFFLVFVWTAYQTVSLSDRMGGVVIQASIVEYQCDVFRCCGQELKV